MSRAALAVASLLAACGGGSKGGGTGPCTPGAATQLVKNAGDAQAWYFNNPLPATLSVKALDANNCAVPGVVINWAVASGGGGVSPAQSTTGTNGVASATDSIGSSTPQSVTATPAITTLPTLTFTATAAAPATTGAVDVKDNFFSPQSVVIKTGGTVTWTWGGAQFHNVTFTGGPTPRPADGPNQTTGTYTSGAITNVGTYTYHCTNHAGMTATLTVVH
jgi:plastocyanin